MRNCTLVANAAVEQGGALYHDYSGIPKVYSSIFWNNNAGMVPEISWKEGAGYISVTYSCVAGGYAGTGNIDQDPLFVDAPHRLQLRVGSPCIDTGTNEEALAAFANTGKPR